MRLVSKEWHRLLLVGLMTCGVAACASGERFGSLSADESGLVCDENADCWDGDPATEDTCTPQGDCVFLANIKPDAEKDEEELENACHAVAEVSSDAEIDAVIERLVPEAVHTVPVEYGTLYRVSVGARSHLEVRLEDEATELVMFVLLDDCANASKNRIAWGRELCTEEIEPGSYILAVFSERVSQFGFTLDFLEPDASCAGLDAPNDR